MKIPGSLWHWPPSLDGSFRWAKLGGQCHKLPGIFIGQRHGLLDKHILAGFEEFPAQRKMGLGGGDHDHGIDFIDERLVVGGEAFGWETEFAGRFELFLTGFGHVQFDGQIVEVAQVVGAPAADAEQENFCHQINGPNAGLLRIGDRRVNYTIFGGKPSRKSGRCDCGG